MNRNKIEDYFHKMKTRGTEHAETHLFKPNGGRVAIIFINDTDETKMEAAYFHRMNEKIGHILFPDKYIKTGMFTINITQSLWTYNVDIHVNSINKENRPVAASIDLTYSNDHVSPYSFYSQFLNRKKRIQGLATENYRTIEVSYGHHTPNYFSDLMEYHSLVFETDEFLNFIYNYLKVKK